MLVSDIYLTIKQGLSPIGQFTGGNVLDSEIALAIDQELLRIESEISKSLSTETTIFTTVLLNDLKSNKLVVPIYTEGSTAILNLPSDYLRLISDKSLIVIEGKDYDLLELKIGNYYRANPTAKINNTWYKESQVVKAQDKDYYGKVLELDIKYIPNDLMSSEKVSTAINSSFSKPTSRKFISEFISQSQIKVYTSLHKSCIDSLLGVDITYYKKPTKFSNLSTTVNSPYSDTVNKELIDLTIQKLKNIN